jgi:ribose transport system permease protein
VLLMLSLGLVLVLTTGDFDLSIASNLSLAAMLVSVLNVNDHFGIVLAIILSVGASTFLGVLNGGLVVLLGIDSFIVTLGTGTVALGVVQWISGGNDITGTTPGLTTWTIGNRIGGISLIFFYGVAATLFLFYVFEFTPLGRRLLFVGRGLLPRLGHHRAPVARRAELRPAAVLRWRARDRGGGLAVRTTPQRDAIVGLTTSRRTRADR